jgi:hypothetical protein
MPSEQSKLNRREYMRRYIAEYRKKDKPPEIPPAILFQAKQGKIIIYLCPNKHLTFTRTEKTMCEEKACYQKLHRLNSSNLSGTPDERLESALVELLTK